MIRIPSHILVFTLLVGGTTVAAFAYSRAYGKTDDEKRMMLENNSNRGGNREESKKRMQAFFDNLKSKDNHENINDTLDALLKAGKSDGKRITPVTISKLKLNESDKETTKEDEKGSLLNNQSNSNPSL